MTDPTPGQRSSLQTLYAPSLTKLIVLSVTSFGFYLIYWGYKNWKAMKESGRTLAWPAVCAFFLPFTLFSLLDKVEAEVKNLKTSSRSLTTYALAFLIVNLCKLIPFLGILVFFINFIPLIPINRAFAAINEANQNTRADYQGFTKWSIGWLVLWTGWLGYHVVRGFLERQ